jgi:hypothetical protein
MILNGKITSTREVRNEVERYGDKLSTWVRQSAEIFATPTAEELAAVREIFQVEHFQAMIRSRERLRGSPVADPFVVARAKCLPEGCVVTTEIDSPNAAKIPNVCEHFGVDWTNLEGFMERESWRF